MVDTNWGDFADRAYPLDSDVLLVMDAGGGGINVPMSALLHRDAAGNARLFGGRFDIFQASTGVPAPALGQVGAETAIFISQGAAFGLATGVFSSGSSWTQAMHNGVAVAYNYSLQPSGGDLVLCAAGAAVRPGGDNGVSLGLASARFSVVFAGSGAISTSDRREKQQIGSIPEAWLDAWAGVRWQRFKFNDAVVEKGEHARWHFGLIAQDVRDAFVAADIDAFSIGLLCFDRWDAVTEPVMREVKKTRKVPKLAMVPLDLPDHPGAVMPQQIEVDEEYTDQEDTGQTRVVREAGERYGIRYDLAQAIEAAYQRRRADRLETDLTTLIGRVEAIEARAAE